MDRHTEAACRTFKSERGVNRCYSNIDCILHSVPLISAREATLHK